MVVLELSQLWGQLDRGKLIWGEFEVEVSARKAVVRVEGRGGSVLKLERVEELSIPPGGRNQAAR